ncbi:MAG: hypothetical protein M3O41_00435 [Pseudomonadota bacterium]|nr:hypothetical protein [Pseudomonadota bacterium]
MSWGTISGQGPAESIRDWIEAAHDKYEEMMRGANEGFKFSTETKEQIEAAKDSAVRIATSRCAGEYVRVNLQGHSNPGHKATPGWAADTVSVNVWAVEREETPPSTPSLTGVATPVGPAVPATVG